MLTSYSIFTRKKPFSIFVCWPEATPCSLEKSLFQWLRFFCQQCVIPFFRSTHFVALLELPILAAVGCWMAHLDTFLFVGESMDSGEEKPWVNPPFEDFEDLESTFCAMDGAWISWIKIKRQTYPNNSQVISQVLAEFVIDPSFAEKYRKKTTWWDLVRATRQMTSLTMGTMVTIPKWNVFHDGLTNLVMIKTLCELV